ncbi:HEAT repeat domain-containing protein [Halobaculum sp. MBLA0147]|uniref:HEAT repeat domain-containing protein n=1 Tax=Halobaculum sp. MBLA0147 TaxID=3079934 RepID=UPI003523ACF8
MSDDAPADGDGGGGDDEETAVELSVDEFEERFDDLAAAVEDAETEADLDDVEADLDALADKLEAADLPEADDEDEEDPAAALDDRLSSVRDELEAARGPYAADVADEFDDVRGTIEDTRWTDDGLESLAEAVATAVAAVGDALGAEVDATTSADEESLADALETVATAVTDAGLDADDDAETIAALLTATDELAEAVEAAEEWDDLETREQLEAQGFYDVLGHYKDFPPEWAAVKEWEQRGNVEMVLLALDSLQSEFMEKRCLESLTRMNDQGAFDAMHQRAQKRDQPGIRALGKMAAADAVETLLEYVDADSNPQLQEVTFKALGEIGHEDAVQPLANKLVMENDQVRPYAARALGMIGDTRAVEPLRDTLADDEVDTVRAAAAWALRQIGTERALRAASGATDDEAYIVQAEADRAADALDTDEEPAATA